jgi:hypothetical protein
MNTPSHAAKALIWPTTFAGLLGAAVLTVAVFAGPADAETPAAVTSTVLLQR